jgi:large subunit ribosomal protein L15
MTDRKKSRKKRGYMRHSGLRRRGSGNRGGVGRAGTGKRRSHSGKNPPVKKNKGFTVRKNIPNLEIVNVGDLERMAEGSSVSLENTKVLGRGKITKKLEVTAGQFSESAKKKIEAAGGKAVGRS